MSPVDGQADHTLPAHVRADLDDLRQALVQGRDVVARNLLSYLAAEVLPILSGPARSALEHHLAVMTDQLSLPRTRRFKQPATTPSRRRAAAGFRCAFCRQSWGWDAAIRRPGDRGYACTSCAKTVMCPSCGRRKQDGYPVCYRCSGRSSVTSKPHGFHS
jgi:hypothetical protein